MTVRIINADVMAGLAQLEDESVQCVVTSPPYWGLRDYGVPGQLGLEPTLGEHIDKMVDVFREVCRVLRKDGTLWLNYGDSYAASPNGRSAADTKAIGNDDRTFRDKPFSTVGPISRPGRSRGDGPALSDKRNRNGMAGFDVGDLKPKDLCGVPWRVAFALQADGWWLRQDIIWSKPNPMPESIKDRCTKAHEYLFLLAKSERYFFNAQAISEPIVTGDNRRPYGSPGANALDHRGEQGAGKPRKNRATFRGGSYCNKESFANNSAMSSKGIGDAPNYPGTRNKRSVWEIATQPFSEAHFATFPPALIEPCIKAGSKEGDTVLDPFGGSGTTGMVADRLKRNAILIELNPEYAAMAERRIKGDCPMFSEVMA